MATTITAPVKVAHSGEVDPALWPESSVGLPFPDFTGASSTASGQVSVKITCAEEGVPDVTVFVTAATSLWSTAGVFSYIPARAGMYLVTVTDVTAAETATTKIEVFESEGL